MTPCYQRKHHRDGNHGQRNSITPFAARLTLVSLLVLLPYSKSESSSSSITTSARGRSSSHPLASIPTHHGINASLHLNGGGGAVTTRSHWKRRLSERIPNSVSGWAADTTGATTKSDEETTTSALAYPSFSATYSVKPASENELSYLEKIEVKNGNTASSSTTATSTKSLITGSSSSSSTTQQQQMQTRPQSQQQEGLSPTAITCMSLLALQFGIQPILVRKFTPQTIVRSSVVLVQELVKFGIAGAIYFSGTEKSIVEKDFEGWSIKTWIALAGLPAFLYTIQNIASLMAYQNLEALTFNVLNQTKILSAALSCYFVMGKRQSKMQVVSLCLLIVSTLVIEKIVHPSAFISLVSMRGGAGTNVFKGLTGALSSLKSFHNVAGVRVTHGIIPIVVASLISGLAGALTQLNLQGGASSKPLFWGRKSTKSSSSSVSSRPPRNAYLFSMEMNIASVILLLGSLFCSSDGRSILRSPTSFFSEWTPQTFIPVITNAIGGILVGLVTKHAGSVRKGFALIFGLLLSGIFQANGAGIRSEQIVGGALAGLSLWMHTVHPHVAVPVNKKN